MSTIVSCHMTFFFFFTHTLSTCRVSSVKLSLLNFLSLVFRATPLPKLMLLEKWHKVEMSERDLVVVVTASVSGVWMPFFWGMRS